MIITETDENKKLVKHYSDKKLYIKQAETGEVYDEAWDLLPCPWSYVETERQIEE